MDTPNAAAAAADAEIARRLERIAARRPSPERSGPPSRTTGTPTPASGGGAPARRRRRHAARGSRMAALALSLATTAGLAAAFRFADGPASSVATASGGIESASGPTVVTGDVFTNRFGPVQVKATFDPDGTIASVDAVQTPAGDGRSVRINDQAVPVLDSEVLSTQSALVHTVSGATYTSESYRQSLQSAIDTARAAGVTRLV